MPPLRLLLVASALAGGTSLALGACGEDDGVPGRGGDDAPRTSTKASKSTEKAEAAAKAAGVPAAAGGALTEGAVKLGLPSVVAITVNTGGDTRNGTGTLLATGAVVTDAALVTTAAGTPTAGVTVREGNGEEHSGVVDGIDRLSGLAVLRVREMTAVPIAKITEDPPLLGQALAGIGFLSARRPGLRPGSVVTTDRAVRKEGIAEVGLFEATASLGSQGFGGPVVDAEGRVVGITTRALSSMVPGTVVALPAASAQRITKALSESGRVKRAFLGLETVGVTPPRAEALRLQTSTGVLLRSVLAGSPAAFAPFKKPTSGTTIGGRVIPTGGDVIVGIDKTRIVEPEDIDRVLANRAPGRRVAVKVIRGDRAVTVRVTLGER